VAVSAKWYGLALKDQFGAAAAERVDWASDTIRVALLGAGYTPNQDTDRYWSDVSANEVSSAGYTAGGVALASKTLTYTGASNTVALGAAASSWTGVTFSPRYAVVYKDTGVAASSPLLGFVDFGGLEVVLTGLFTLQWDATAGVLSLTAA
jgi:hypothetical protein